MNQLIKVETKTIGSEEVNAINARELHSFLESKQDFSTWIKSRIDQYDFIQDIDFIQFHNFVESNSKARIEYIISLDMAKELSMVERNEKGKEARKYFIECEKIAKGKSKPLTTLEIMAQSVKILQDHEAKMLMIESKQNDIDSKINEIEAKISTSNSDYYSISGYASLKGFRHLDIRKANLIGKLAAKLSRAYGVDIGKVKDERYGSVNIYHIDILNEAFNRKI